MAADNAYVDTSVICCHAQGSVPTAPARHASIRSSLEAVFASGATVAISELTLIEYHDVLLRKVRNAAQEPMWDDEWARSSLAATMAAIRSGALTVIPAPPKAPEHALQLLEYATREQHAVGFKLWDAMHLVIATNWAYEVGENVELLTADRDFGLFVAAVPAFNRLVRLVDLNP